MQVAFALLTLFALAACSDTCADNEHQAVRSPNGKHLAILFDRDLGATTGFNTHVSVVDSNECAMGVGNTFIADQGTQVTGGGPWAEVSWIGPDLLLVRYDATARVFVKNENVGAVQVRYSPMSH